LPGVEHVSSSFAVPWRDSQALTINFAFAGEGAARKNGQDDYRARFRSISPDYFGTLGMPLLAGRDFRDTDRDGTEPVVIISQSLAKTLYPNGDAVNHTLRWTDGVLKFIGIAYSPRRIVGVVPDFDDENIIPSPAMTIYQPSDQEGWASRLLVRTSGDPYALMPAITHAIHEIAADQPVEHPATLQDIRAEVLSPDRLNAIVFGGFAAVALLISVVGVAGVLAFSVSGRTREFGIRFAMGAGKGDILTEVLSQGAVIAGIGVVAGLVLGVVLVRVIATYFADVHLPGIFTFVISGLVIFAAAMVASAVPAARAARINAVEALRSE
jgi:putative ABC transport system permease protein